MNRKRCSATEGQLELFGSELPVSESPEPVPELELAPEPVMERDVPLPEPESESALPNGRDSTLEAHARELVAAIGMPDLARRIIVTWSARLTTTAGMASWRKATVKLNPRLVAVGDDEVERTLRHELAHIVAQEQVGDRRIPAHGKLWRDACAALGIPGEKTTHSLPFPRRKIARRHLYRCGNCGLEVPRVRPFRRAVACSDCCGKLANGRYEERFRLVKVRGYAL